CISCQSNQPAQETSIETNPTATSMDYLGFELKAGDILFQDVDCGPFCESIEKVTSGVGGAKFSHVGLVIPKEKEGLVVIEAVSAGVVQTPLDSFFSRSFDANKQSKVVVGRMKQQHEHLIPKAIDFAQTKLGYPYDEVFDIANQQYYCSELIYYAFKHANKNSPIFQLQAMTYKDPATNSIFPIWADYFQELNVPIPEGAPGLNPGGMSKSDYINILHFYGKPQGYGTVTLIK
ncbi:MAG: YiiX/YebB-like N1pC/P60 family cysteine hydrolase, partial [Aureispira sp.]